MLLDFNYYNITLKREVKGQYSSFKMAKDEVKKANSRRNRGDFRKKRRYTMIRKINNLNKIPKKNYQCRQIIDSKLCQLCRKRDQDDKFILCDECDDAYHMPCLDPPLLTVPEGQWLCPSCQALENQLKKKNDEGEYFVPQICRKCAKKLDIHKKIKYQDQDGQIIEEPRNNIVSIQCLYCQNWFHEDCLSPRDKSLNCYDCEMFLRNSCPKNHLQFVNFIKKQAQLVHKSGYLQLYDQPPNQIIQKFQSQTPIGNNYGDNNRKKRVTYFSMQLKMFKEPTHWQPITRYEASLYYALKTKRLIFCDQQLYKSQQLLSKNNSSKDVLGVRPLHDTDSQTYQIFKCKIKNGAVGPYQIKQDRLKGFYVETTAQIQKNTIICEYSGEICCHRQSLKQIDNDSIFTLLIAGSSQEDLNIIPNKFGNISRFICGVNNSDKQQLRAVNVQAIKFSFRGRMRIIFVAKKCIEKGETLYLNYNDGTYEEYPTDNFIK